MPYIPGTNWITGEKLGSSGQVEANDIGAKWRKHATQIATDTGITPVVFPFERQKARVNGEAPLADIIAEIK